MKKYQYILLDWDGNLAKTLDVWLVAFREALNASGYYPSDLEIAASFGRFNGYANRLGIDNPEEVLDMAVKIAKVKLPNVELYPDTLEILEYFKSKNKKTALITSSFRNSIEHLIKRYGLEPLFDTVLCYEDTVNHKPHTEPIDKALLLLGGNHEQAIIIGDSETDLGAAANAGMDSILFHSPEHKKFHDIEKLKRHNPTYIVEDFREIKQIIT